MPNPNVISNLILSKKQLQEYKNRGFGGKRKCGDKRVLGIPVTIENRTISFNNVLVCGSVQCTHLNVSFLGIWRFSEFTVISQMID